MARFCAEGSRKAAKVSLLGMVRQGVARHGVVGLGVVRRGVAWQG